MQGEVTIYHFPGMLGAMGWGWKHSRYVTHEYLLQSVSQVACCSLWVLDCQIHDQVTWASSTSVNRPPSVIPCRLLSAPVSKVIANMESLGIVARPSLLITYSLHTGRSNDRWELHGLFPASGTLRSSLGPSWDPISTVSFVRPSHVNESLTRVVTQYGNSDLTLLAEAFVLSWISRARCMLACLRVIEVALITSPSPRLYHHPVYFHGSSPLEIQGAFAVPGRSTRNLPFASCIAVHSWHYVRLARCPPTRFSVVSNSSSGTCASTSCRLTVLNRR